MEAIFLAHSKCGMTRICVSSVGSAPGGPEAQCRFPDGGCPVPGCASTSRAAAHQSQATRPAALGPGSPGQRGWCFLRARAASQLVPGSLAGCSRSCDDFMTLPWPCDGGTGPGLYSQGGRPQCERTASGWPSHCRSF